MDPVKLRHLLIRIVEYNNVRAFSAFFDYYYTRLMNLAILFITQYNQAVEVVIEVFLKLLKKKYNLLNIERFEGICLQW